MARFAAIHTLDDITGEPARETVFFALDGVEYKIDLTAEHADDLRSILTRYIEHARRTGGRKQARRLIDGPTPISSPPARFAPRPTTRRKRSSAAATTAATTVVETVESAKESAKTNRGSARTKAKTGRQTRTNRRTKNASVTDSAPTTPAPKPAKRVSPPARAAVPQVTFSAPES